MSRQGVCLVAQGTLSTGSGLAGGIPISQPGLVYCCLLFRVTGGVVLAVLYLVSTLVRLTKFHNETPKSVINPPPASVWEDSWLEPVVAKGWVGKAVHETSSSPPPIPLPPQLTLHCLPHCFIVD